MVQKGTGVELCFKVDSDLALERGNIVEVTSRDDDTWALEIETPRGNSLLQVGVVIKESPTKNKTVLVRFTGNAQIQYAGSLSIGDSVGSVNGSLMASRAQDGIGTVLSLDQTTPVQFAYVKLGSAGVDAGPRWLSWSG